ncbi:MULTISPECIES: hypothetical protein [Comamonadaceae]|jgi:hypothetical protein|uniref:Uncharacterized protein n=1 Tax=Alicycliphilus denitrificans TaxID=179636 RepID=A0A420KFJ2_9BURK|nr:MULTISPECIES: hypothetical protein [Comamonadaceae]OJW91518.1 MAG: hypothetical protein BGO66_14890 [Alicycliphilus sp. 69-12]MBN9572415.1 hypothetical protein [Alicycliphilus denitrificans]RKJ98698.1 hypothetical protein CE154_002745 [Alicycliphilus denitrificans]BCN37823.1 hypothetical protein ALDI51_11420 [Alicycliphilus denitrificans]HRO81466.1 hypothetical protein [Alicycliphilus denitrificans]
MTISSSPKLTKGGIVLIDPETAQVQRVIALQYNAESLKRELKSQESGGEAGADRAEPTRFKGPAVETISFEADLDATDQLEFPDQNAAAVAYGIAPQIALLESLSQPGSAQLGKVNSQASSGTLEIAPMLAPLLLLVWGAGRVIPVKLTSFSVTEEAFDPALNPIHAKASLSLRVLTVDDLGFASKGGSLFMAYLQNREQLAAKAQPASLSTLGVAGV